MSLQNKYSGRRDAGVNNPGKLDRRVNLLAPFLTQSGSGEKIAAWPSFASVWASKRETSGNRVMDADGKHNISIVDFRIRHRGDVVPMQRIVHGNDTYEIINTNELGRQHYLDLTCRAFDQTVGSGGGTPAQNLFTAFTAYANASGDTAITPQSVGFDTAQVTLTGSAGVRNLILGAGKSSGAIMYIPVIFPATAGIDIQVRNLTAGGTLLYDLTSDTSAAQASFQLTWDGANWQRYNSNYPA